MFHTVLLDVALADMVFPVDSIELIDDSVATCIAQDARKGKSNAIGVGTGLIERYDPTVATEDPLCGP